MSRRNPDFAWFAVRVLGSIAGVCVLSMLTACQSVPKELPHYPCQRIEGGKTVYYSCQVFEWLEQKGAKK